MMQREFIACALYRNSVAACMLSTETHLNVLKTPKVFCSFTEHLIDSWVQQNGQNTSVECDQNVLLSNRMFWCFQHVLLQGITVVAVSGLCYAAAVSYRWDKITLLLFYSASKLLVLTTVSKLLFVYIFCQRHRLMYWVMSLSLDINLNLHKYFQYVYICVHREEFASLTVRM